MIEQSQIILLAISTTITILLPIIGAIIWILKTKLYVYPLFIGVFGFFLFALILESAMHSIVFSIFPIISNSTILYIIYGCLAAAFFEEGGRYVVFRYLMKNSHDKRNAVTLGIGYGGFEIISVVGMTLISTLMFAISYNSLGIEGMMGTSNDIELYNMIIEMVISIEAYQVRDVVLSVLERICALFFHISCSVFVFNSVYKNDLNYLGVAFIFHIIMNIPSALYQRQVITDLWIIEVMLLIISSVCSYYAYRIYKRMDCE